MGGGFFMMENLTLVEKILKWFGYKHCDICGKVVEDVEVPNHITRNGGQYVHVLHAVTSSKGRALIKSHAEMFNKTENSI